MDRAVIGMLCVTLMVAMGLATGHDGMLLLTGVATVAALAGLVGGYVVGVRKAVK